MAILDARCAASVWNGRGRSSEKEATPIGATTPGIDRLLTQPDVERLLSRIKHALQDTIALTVQIAQIPAPTGDEAERAAFVAQEMAAAGLADVHTDAVGNVIGRHRGTGGSPAVMLAAHTDTVFPVETDVTVRRSTERIAGPGVGDNSLGVAAMLTAARLLHTLNITTAADILFVADVGEEGLGDLRGMREAVSAHREELGAVIAVEGHNLGRVTHRAVGSRRYRLTVRGPGGHSWGNFGRPNAIHVLARLIADLTAIPLPTTAKTSLSVGTIEGGVSVNTIAPSASALVDLRSISQANLERLAAQVERTVRNVHITDVTVTADILGDRPAGELPADAPVVQAALETLRALGITPTLDASSTDANVPIGLGIPAICIGVAEGGNAHRIEEFIKISTIPVGMQQLLLLTLALAGYDAQ